MPGSTTGRVLLLLTAALAACKSGASAQDTCEQIVGCACGTPVYPTVDACVRDFDAGEEAARQRAADRGLVFDADCYVSRFAELEALECRGFSELEDLSALCGSCSPIHGDKPLGAACTRSAQGDSDCASGLSCLSYDFDGGDATGVCYAPCEVAAAGEPCTVEVDDGTYLQTCVDGYGCSGESGRCEPRQADGTTCLEDDLCVSDNCDDMTAQCRPMPGEGDACDFVCADPFVCSAGSCVAAPGVGEPCLDDRCAPGARCAGDVCVDEEPLVCGIDFTPTPP